VKLGAQGDRLLERRAGAPMAAGSGLGDVERRALAGLAAADVLLALDRDALVAARRLLRCAVGVQVLPEPQLALRVAQLGLELGVAGLAGGGRPMTRARLRLADVLPTRGER
jgi:hypothetical protein